MTNKAPPDRVLVVEDNPVNRRILKAGVEKLGHEVTTAADGVEALDHLRAHGADLVLLDLVMPVLDGFGVLEAMRADPALDPIPVIVISAVDETDLVARSIELGALDCLPKPFEPQLLKVRVDVALRQRRLRQLEQAYLRQELALRQQDKLATLGRLSAGLAHELNNPVAAAVRMARQLQGHLSDAQVALSSLVDDVDLDALTPADNEDEGQSATERMDDEAALEELLAGVGVSDPWILAGDLAARGVRTRDVAALIGQHPPERARPLLQWLAARTAVVHTVDQLTTSLDRVSGIIGALKSYSYMDRAEQQSVDLHQGLEDTLTILAHKTPDAVELRRDYGTVPTIMGMGGQLNQVWTNLIDNAIDAVGETGVITIRTRSSQSEVCVEIEDDGAGVPEELQARIFDPFVSTKAPGSGTGLGLNIAHQIVTDGHGGRLDLHSEPGRTVFTVTLPRTANQETSV